MRTDRYERRKEGESFMYQRIIFNDLKKSRFISLTTLLFVAVSTMMLALAAILFINLTGAIDGLMWDAKTPHFMQMHSGEMDLERLESFSTSNPDVESFQVMEFVNVEDWHIIVEGQTLEGGVQDNGIVKQGEHFDFLLNLDGEVIEPQEGDIFVPLMYMKNGAIQKGDVIELYGHQLTAVGFLRDSQMNSPLSSSKRFLVSDADFEAIQPYGEMEYLISFRLTDLGELSGFEGDYVAAGLESNGPTLTDRLFRVINGLSDGLLIAVILLVSLLAVVITFLCIRFTLVARMEDDQREIGVLKAVGLHNKDIIRLYLSKYAVLTLLGCALGYGASHILKEPLLEDIQLMMGVYHQPAWEMLLGMGGAFAILLVVLLYVYHVLGKIRGISVTESIRMGGLQDRSGMVGRFLMSRSRVLNSNVFLAVKDLLGRKKLYLTMMIILLIAMFMMTLPQGLHSTISSEHFVSYMGVGKSDLRIDIQQTTDIREKARDISAAIQQDGDISRHVVLTASSYVVRDELGREARLLIETGDHSLFPIIYSRGRMPTEPEDIAISAMNAEELEKDVGDRLTVVLQGKEVELTVCGIYSDITNGGKTAKAAFADSEEDVMWSTISADVEDPSRLPSVLSRYGENFTYAKVTGVDEYIKMTFGATTGALGKASAASSMVALFISFFMTLLFVKMLVAKDRFAIAILKSVGHHNRDIRFQFLVRVLLIGSLSICLGISLTMTLGERLAGLLIASFGATHFSFEINALLTYGVSPALMMMVVTLATMISTRTINSIHIAQNIKE